jgi:hypothetical protein
MYPEMQRALTEVGATLDEDFPIYSDRRPLDTADFEEFAKSARLKHEYTIERGGTWTVELFADKFFNAPMQVAMRLTAPDGSVKHYEVGCKHEWKTQSSSIPRRGIYDYRCSKCGATYTYDSSD